jgi:hypothetical protein
MAVALSEVGMISVTESNVPKEIYWKVSYTHCPTTIRGESEVSKEQANKQNRVAIKQILFLLSRMMANTHPGYRAF